MDVKSLPIEIVVMGSESSGKKSLVYRFINDEYGQNPMDESKTSALYFSKSKDVDGMSTKYKMWILSSNEKYKFLWPMYYSSAHVILVCVDLDSDQSYKKAKEIVQQLKDAQLSSLIVFVLCKEDLDYPNIKKEEAANYANFNDLWFTQLSAKTGKNVDELFNKIARSFKDKLYKRMTTCPIVSVNRKGNSGQYEGIVELRANNRTIYIIQKDEIQNLSDGVDRQIMSQLANASIQSAHRGFDQKRPTWTPDELVHVCSYCHSSFNMFNRKHHCRACGQVFCNICSSHYSTIPKLGYDKAVRVCKQCHDMMT